MTRPRAPVVSVSQNVLKFLHGEASPLPKGWEWFRTLPAILKGHDVALAIVVTTNRMWAKMSDAVFISSGKTATVNDGLSDKIIGVHGALPCAGCIISGIG
jgi:hypothetical protein